MHNLHLNFRTLTRIAAISILIITVFSSFIQTANATAGINQTINFQGKVVNKTAGTNVADTTYDFMFRIYDAASSGTLLWTEKYDAAHSNPLTVTSGIFRAPLGSVCPFSGGSCQSVTNTAIDFNSDSYYLDITFNGETMGSRVQLNAVPYAFNALKVAGLTVTNNGGNTLTIAANKTLTANNSLTFSGTDGKTLTLSGSTTLADNIITFGGTETLTLAATKNVSFADAYAFAGTAGTITFQGTDTYVGRATTDTLTNKTIGSTGLVFSGATTDITTAGNEDLAIDPAGTGRVTINHASASLASLDIRSNSGTIGVASVSGSTSFASLVVDQTGVGDIFTASSAGKPLFTVLGSGGIADAGVGAGLTFSGTGNHDITASGGTLRLGAATLTGAIAGGSQNITGIGTINGLAITANTGVITTGTWNGTVIDSTYGGTGVNNAGRTLTVNTNSGTLAFGSAKTLTISGSTTLADNIITFGGTETLTLTATKNVSFADAYAFAGTAGTITLQGTDTYVGRATTDILTNKTLTAPTINGTVATSGLTLPAFTLAGSITGSGTPNITGIGSFSGASLTITGSLSANAGIGTNTQCLLGGSTAAWGSCGGGGSSFFASLNGTIYPTDLTNDLLIGGNSTSSAKFHVYGANLATQGTSPVASIGAKTSYAAFVVDQQGLGDIFTASASGLNRFVIQNNGNVGIGTTTPAYILDVNQNTNGGALVSMINPSTGNVAYEGFQAGQDASTKFVQYSYNNQGFGGGTLVSLPNSAVNYVGSGATSGFVIDVSANAPIIFGTGGTALTNERMRITGTGTVGIGTTVPLATFDVRSKSGSMAIASASGATTFAALVSNNDGVGDLFTASASSQTRFVITNNGNVGIGTTIPAHALEFAAGTTTGAAGIGLGTDLQLYRSGTRQLNIDGNGGGAVVVNIGTTNKLTLIGDFATQGEMGAGVQLIGTGSTTTNILGGDGSSGGKLVLGYWNGGGLSALEITNVSSGFGTLSLMKSGGTVGVGLGSNTTRSTVDLRALSGTIAVASVSGTTSFANLVVDQTGVGDIFTASSAGKPLFTIMGTGDIAIKGTTVLSSAGILQNAALSGTYGSAVTLSSATLTAPAINGTVTTSGLTLPAFTLAGAIAGGGNSITGVNSLSSTSLTISGSLTANSQTGAGLCLTGGTTATWASCGGGSSQWVQGSGVIYPIGPYTATTDLLLGGTSTSSAKIAFINLANGEPTASIAGSITLRNGTGLINRLNGGDISFQTSAGGDAGLGTKVTIRNNGNVGIGTAVAGVKLEVIGTVKSTVGTQSLYITGDESGLRTISSDNGDGSGIYYFKPGGTNVGYTNNVFAYSSFDDKPMKWGTSGSNYSEVVFNSTTQRGEIVNFGTVNAFNIQPNLLVGTGGTTALATLDVRGNSGTLSVASVSGKTSKAGLTVDNSGTGDIFTASSSGTTRFSIRQNGSVVMQAPVLTNVGVVGSAGNSNAVINAIGDQGSLIPNAGFESATIGTTFADGWVAAASNSAVVTRDTSVTVKGNSSAKVVLTNSSTAFYSACVPLTGATANTIGYVLNWYSRGVTPLPTVRAYIDSYTTQANCQSNTSPTISAAQGTVLAATGTWSKQGSATTAVAIGATATWGRVHFFVGSNGTNATVNIDGVRLIQATVGSGNDYAENYPADPNNTPEPGDVISLTTLNGKTVVVPANKPSDDSVVGVVSTDPGELLGQDTSSTETFVPVAMAGRIPTKVSTKNGAIHLGDYLTSSNIPGVAVKATSAGPVIGTAMEDYTASDPGEIGKVIMFVKNTYYGGTPSSSGLVGANGQDSQAFINVLKQVIKVDQKQISLNLDENGTLVIKNKNGDNVITFDDDGNAVFNGIIRAKAISADSIEGLQVLTNKVSSLDASYASLSASVSNQPDIASIEANILSRVNSTAPRTALDLASEGLATVSGNLRVKGDGMFEGILSVIDTLTTNNFIVNGISTFFSDVVFKGNVNFEGRPTFNSDSAGFATIKKGDRLIDIKFDQEYISEPAISANLYVPDMTSSLFSSYVISGICESSDTQSECQVKVENEAFDNSNFVITAKSTKGFRILLKNDATLDTKFSWNALDIKNAKTFDQSKTLQSLLINP